MKVYDVRFYVADYPEICTFTVSGLNIFHAIEKTEQRCVMKVKIGKRYQERKPETFIDVLDGKQRVLATFKNGGWYIT